MQLKKNPNADLTKNSSLYFAIGLAVVLFISWQAIEWKTYDKSGYGYEALNVDDEDDEEVPITEQIKTPPPPPPPPPAPEVLEVVEDEEEVEETIIESTETDQEEIVEVEDIEVEDDFDDVDVPFAVIEDVPIYPGCEKVAKSQRRQCFQDQINKHIRKNFRYPEIAQEMGIQGRVYVNFVIAKDGSITNVRMRGPDKNLEKEAARIISKLPSMTPGKQRGRPVRVPFSIPITFRLQ
ncbi:energy transducer TonB [Flavobacteriaceae bacterium]|jgi:protein TonB|nr:energy transducer TonB [Flavobacteriaceae bacterium]MDA9886590.1 energy transducer TonB [Flavobacteriaceae bacterium]MDB2672650.1 energy transducer TonB [Flavobacteriaceae bacterium]MDB4186559.1 energy transducer TonB [Flavobacteriaceae bacterium]MDC0014182.1 energy transducer TonB [Flavobacteriaceae bacterium]